MRYINLLFLLCAAFSSFSQWEEVTIPTTNSFYSVDIHESGVCYAGGIAFIKSDDFGVMWEEVDFPGADSLYFDFVVVNDVKVLSSEVTVAVGWHVFNNNNMIMRTNDNGLTWTLTFDGPHGTGRQFRAVDFYNELNGVAVADDGLAYKTADGGINWTYCPTGTLADFTSVAYVSPTKVVVGANEKILRSTDGGLTWVIQTHTGKYYKSVEYEAINDVVTATYQLAPDFETYVNKSTNSGLSWSSIAIPEGNIYCHKPLDGDSIFFGFGYDMFLGLEGGEYLYRFVSPTIEGSRGVDFESGVGLAVTSFAGEGKVYRFSYDEPWELEQIVDFIGPDEVCQDDSATYTPSNLTLDSYEWLIDGTSVSFDSILTYVHSEPGDILIELITEFEGHLDTLSQMTEVMEAPTITDIDLDWGSDTLICRGDLYTFILRDIADGTGYRVYQDGELITHTFATGDDRNYHRGEAHTPSVFQVDKWVINDCDSIGLTLTFTFEIEEFPDSSNSFHALEDLVCLGDSGQIILPTPALGTSYTLFQDGDSIATSTALTVDPISFNTLPIYSGHGFQMEATSAAGCYTEMVTIDSIEVDEVSAAFDIGIGYYLQDSLITINTDGIIGSIYEWSVSGSPSVLENTDLLHPEIAYDVNGYYDINLLVETEAAGCKDSLTDTLTIFLSTPPDSTDKAQCFVKDINRIEVLDQTIDPFGNIILVGYKRVESAWGNVAGGVIQKYDSDGNLLWEWVHERDVPGDSDHKSVMYSGVTTDQFGNIYFIGSVNIVRFKYRGEVIYEEAISYKRSKTFVMKVNPSGDFIWMNYASAFSGDFSDVMYDLKTNSLFVCGAFRGGASAYLISTLHGSQYVEQGDLQILHLDPTGLFITHYIADAGEHDLSWGRHVPTGISDARYCYTQPVMEMSSDSLIYLLGPVHGYLNFEGVDSFYSLGSGQYIAILDPYGPESGWLRAQIIPGTFGSKPEIRATFDSDNNVYISSGYDPEFVDETIDGHGSGIFKFDSELNLIWYRVFKNIGIKDIYCTKDNEIYMIGGGRKYCAFYADGEPLYLSVYPDSAFQLQSLLGIINTDGELDWLEQIGYSSCEEMFRLAANSCGDIVVSARSTTSTYYPYAIPYSAEGANLQVEISNVVYPDSINGTFLIKLSDTTCIPGGCGILCEDEDLFPIPPIFITDRTLSTEVYVTYQWYKDDMVIFGATGPTFTVTELGTYKLIVTDLNGCYGESEDFEVTCEYDGFIPEPIIAFDDGVVSTGLYPTYQWLLDGEIIPGANEQTYVCMTSGTYSVSVTNEFGCVGESNPFFLDNLDIQGINESITYISLNPNPSKGNVFLEYTLNETASIEIRITDISGKMIFTRNLGEINKGRHTEQLDLGFLAAGTYFYVLSVNQSTFTNRIIISK